MGVRCGLMVAVAVMVASVGTASASPVSEHQQVFSSFVTRFQRQYDLHEFFHRFNVFSANLAVIEAHNAGNHTWQMGVGPFADLTESEFTQTYAQGLKVPSEWAAPNTEHVEFTGNGAFDWVKAGKVASIKNQGNCGSCWAFATSAGIESFEAIKYKSAPTDLSPQYLVDCAVTSTCHGCGGGWMPDAMTWIHSNGGTCTWKEYPYVGVQQQCRRCASKLAPINGARTFSGEGAIENTGGQQPVVVGLDVSNWQHYASGLFTGPCGTQPQHAVVVVGAGRVSNQPAWMIKNSWGTGWGAGGYIYLQAGRNLCNIGNWPSVPT